MLLEYGIFNNVMDLPNEPSQPVVDYFQTLESRLGYDLITYGAKHFGYYPKENPHISEKKAQQLMQDLLIEKLQLKKDSRVLDAGCGEGVVGCYVAQKTGALIEGITVTPFEVDKANRLTKRLNLSSKAHFQVMDYVTANFANSTFDAIYTMESLVHSYDLEKTLANFYRLLKPGGIYVDSGYSTANREIWTKYPKENKMFDWMIEKTAALSFRKMEHGSLMKLLQNQGFTEIKEEDLTINFLPSVKRLIKLAKIPSFLIHLLRLEDHFVNAIIAADFFSATLQKNLYGQLFRYNMTVAQKPSNTP